MSAPSSRIDTEGKEINNGNASPRPGQRTCLTRAPDRDGVLAYDAVGAGDVTGWDSPPFGTKARVSSQPVGLSGEADRGARRPGPAKFRRYCLFVQRTLR